MAVGPNLLKCARMEDSLLQLLATAPSISAPTPKPSSSSPSTAAAEVDDYNPQRWEDVNSVNSLAAVAKLHCDNTMDK